MIVIVVIRRRLRVRDGRVIVQMAVNDGGMTSRRVRRVEMFRRQRADPGEREQAQYARDLPDPDR